MASFTENDTIKMFVKMESYTPQELSEKKVNDPLCVFNKTDTALIRHLELTRLIHKKNTVALVDLVDAWYSFCEDDLARELNETDQLIASFFTTKENYMPYYSDDRRNKEPVGTINLGDVIISKSKNPFTKTELRFVIAYFNGKIRTEQEQSKAELYTKIKRKWLQFYLTQEA